MSHLRTCWTLKNVGVILTLILTPKMASIWKHPKSPYFTACYTDRDGRQMKRSTKTKDRRQALRIAQDLEDSHRLNMTNHQVRQLYSDTAKTLTGDAFQSAGVRDFLEGWIKRRECELAKSSVSAYGQAKTKFLHHLGERGNVSLDRLTERDILTFRDGLAADLAPVTANNLLKMLRVMLRAARLEGLMQHDVAARVKILRADKGDGEGRRGFTLPELRTVLDAAGDGEWRSLILFGLYTGQRLGDIAALRWSAVDVSAGEVRFLTAKTKRRVLVPLCGPLRDYLLSLPAGDDPGAPVHPRSAALGVSHLSREFGELLARTGLREERTHEKRKERKGQRRELNALSFHSLRHTATSLMKNAGVSAAIVQDIIGHESAEVSRAYTHIEHGTKLAALEKLPDVLAAVTTPEGAGRKKGK